MEREGEREKKKTERSEREGRKERKGKEKNAATIYDQ